MFEGDTALLNLITTAGSIGIVVFLAVLLIVNLGNILFRLVKIGIIIVILIFIVWALSFNYKGSSLANISQQQEIQNLKDKVSKIYNDIMTNYDLADSELISQTENLFSQGATTNSEDSFSLKDFTATQGSFNPQDDIGKQTKEQEITLTSFGQLTEWQPRTYNLEQFESYNPIQDKQLTEWQPMSYNSEQFESDEPTPTKQLIEDKTTQELVLDTPIAETFIPTNTTYTPMFSSNLDVEPTKDKDKDKDKVMPEVRESKVDKDKELTPKKPIYFNINIHGCKGELPKILDYKSSPKKLVYLTTVNTLNNPDPSKTMLTNAYNDFSSTIKPTLLYCGEIYTFEYKKFYDKYREEGKTLNSFLRYEKTNETKNGLPATYAYLYGNWYREDK